MYALVDANSFYASCEQVFRPELRDKPVVVLSNNDGCIVARSAAAKALDIPDLQPYFKVKSLLIRHNVHVFSSNYELYADLSARVVQLLQDFTPLLEVYSIDESFLSLRGLKIDYIDYAKKIKERIWRDVRIPVGIGIAQTKTLAKLANHMAKKSPRLAGICVIDSPHLWDRVFRKIPVNKVWGIGGRLAKKLNKLDIFSIYDLKIVDPKYIRKHFSVNLERTVRELNGECCMDLDLQPASKKQIFSTRSFGNKIESIEGLQQAVSQYATRASVKLREQNSVVKTILVFIQSSRFIDKPYSRSITVELPFPSNDTRMIISAARQGVFHLYKEGVSYAKAGVGLLEIADSNPTQLNFFSGNQSARSQKLMEVFDQLNKYEPQVFFASNGINQEWRMQRQFKSPSYTTKISDIPAIKIS